MIKNIKFAAGMALVAASQLALADVAEVQVSDVNLSVSGGGWWYYLPVDVDWRDKSAGTSVGLNNPSFLDSAVFWHGNAGSSSVVDGASTAMASMTTQNPSDLNGMAAQARVDVSGGQSGWSFAKVIDNQILVAAGSTITVSLKLDSVLAQGAMSQGNAYIELCSTDFTTDTCLPANYAEAVVFGNAAYSGPTTLTASWTSPSTDNTWAKIHIGLTASAESVAAPVPEPTSLALWMAGLVSIALFRRRRA
ncbi:PEP-CTERM sorting domain-containing protein [Roseateles sp. BYS78W]|uniref:PEP-CTERM sorting domain-containing protein n=1 Tax=Pelomonas candidula TaxID=3299025 RepID=A0ABW7H8T8_9BURK